MSIYSKEFMLTRIRMESKNGIAPRITDMVKPCYKTIITKLGTWQRACKMAGVKPRQMPTGAGKRKRSYGYREGNQRTKLLAQVLHLAHQHSEDGSVDVSKCLEYVRRTDVP